MYGEMVWPLDQGAAYVLCVCAPWTRLRHTGDVTYVGELSSSGLRPHHVCVVSRLVSQYRLGGL
jgi:hypothetical protein